jgi:hypothetical protein
MMVLDFDDCRIGSSSYPLLAVAYDIYSRAVLNLSRAKNIRVKTDILWFKFLTTVKKHSRTM